jgi:hypothetical protein
MALSLPIFASVLRAEQALVSGIGSPSLHGSAAALAFQIRSAELAHLSRIQRDREIARLVRSGRLVPLPENRAISINPSLKPAYRHVVPWTRKFLLDLAEAHWAEFHKPLQVNSATRTVLYQRRLRGRNTNAAAESSHVYGVTIDLAKRDMSPREIDWMRKQLLQRESAGRIEATEEFQQLCFHIMVLKPYQGTAGD